MNYLDLRPGNNPSWTKHHIWHDQPSMFDRQRLSTKRAECDNSLLPSSLLTEHIKQPEYFKNFKMRVKLN